MAYHSRMTNNRRKIQHTNNHYDIEEIRTDSDGNFVWAVIFCSEDEMTATGINNPNWRNREYAEWMANDLSSVPTWDELMKIKAVKETYGEGWEETADNLHAAVELAAAQEYLTDKHPADVAYELEKAMDANDPRTEWERDWDDYCADVTATRESDRPF